MPQSKKRAHHHQEVPPPHRIAGRKNHAIVYVAIIFFALLGMGITFFAAGDDTSWLVAGAIAGGIAGFFFGRLIDKSIYKS